MMMDSRCSAACDIFSLGGTRMLCLLALNAYCWTDTSCPCKVVLWEVVTQERPIRGQMRELECASAQLVLSWCSIRAVLAEQQVACRRAGSDCPAEVVALIESCLARAPEDRPSAKEVAQVLEALCARTNSP